MVLLPWPPAGRQKLISCDHNVSILDVSILDVSIPAEAEFSERTTASGTFCDQDIRISSGRSLLHEYGKTIFLYEFAGNAKSSDFQKNCESQILQGDVEIETHEISMPFRFHPSPARR
jgi:hypothetical protein